MVIAEGTVRKVEMLLAEGDMSRRKIAKKTGVSRCTVNNIANGTRRVYKREADIFDVQLGPLVRCTGCGGKTQLPCRVCKTRKDKGME